MKKEKDLNYIASVEKAIKEKYGEETIVNPKSRWNKEKESKYLEGLKKLYDKKREKSPKVEVEGFLLSGKRATMDSTRSCPVCSSYSFDIKDDLYMNKFKCCFECYIKHVEGREVRWKSGWRPKKQ